MNDRLQTALRVVSVLLVVGAVILVGLFAVPGAIGAEESFVILTGSMAPELQPGDVVVVRHSPPAEIERGDVITYRADGAIGGEGVDRVTHRVIERKQTADGVAFRTKGDANDVADAGLVTPNQIVGTVWFHVPAVGWLLHATQQPLGNVLAIVVPGLLLVWNGVRTLADAFAETDQSG